MIANPRDLARRGFLAALLAAGFLSTGPDGRMIAAAAEADIPAKIALNFTWQATYMPLLYGEAKGYFKAVHIALEVTPMQGTNQALQMIESAKVDYAFVDSDSFLTAAAQGKTSTIAVYVWLDQPTLDIVSMAPLSGPKAMSGKSFGTTSFSAGRTTLPYILQQNGVDPKSVDVQGVDFSVLFPTFFNGGFDTVEIRAPGSWQSLLARAKAQGKHLYLTRMSDWGLTGYDKILIVRNDVLRDRPAEVKQIVAAIHHTLIEALAHASDAEVYDLLKPQMPQAEQGPLVADWHDYKDLVKKPGPIDPKVFSDSLARLKDLKQIADIPPLDRLYRNQIQ
jgi:ABC-type nitrate/sulfonate/bicarbonate transport system substrate-binding protein